jgi:hypothetical protein
MKYSARAQALIDQWTARVGGLDTLRILGDVLAEDGDERMASACRDAVCGFEAEKCQEKWVMTNHRGTRYWFSPIDVPSRMTEPQWALFLPKDRWHAIELYADFPELDEDGTGATELRGAA